MRRIFSKRKIGTNKGVPVSSASLPNESRSSITPPTGSNLRTMGSKQDALKLMEKSQILESFSQELKNAFSEIMRFHQVEDGHIFVQEGAPIDNFLIIQEGVLGRYKTGLGEEHLSGDTLRESVKTDAVWVDTVEGVGRVTGFFQNLTDDSSPAYATIVAKGPGEVWSVKGTDMRELVKSNGSFGLELLGYAAQRLRVESKITRGLLKKFNAGSSACTANGKLLKVICYDTSSWVSVGFRPALEEFNKSIKDEELEIRMDFTEERLSAQSAAYATGYDAICTFVNDTASADIIQTLSLLGVKMIAQRAAGFDRIDTNAARAFGITVARVPEYSPYAVAEFGISLLMAVNRKITRASNRVKMSNFALDEGLMGMDIHGKTISVMGTGKIGCILCNIILGFGAKLLCNDVFENEAVKAAGGVYVSKDEVYEKSDIIFLMMPLLPTTKHTINEETISKCKHGVIIINTSRGGLIDTKALLQGLQSGIISGVGMDVYENEEDYFFQDWSARNIPDPDLVALLGNHKVVLTAHQSFFTKEAVDKIISTTLENLRDFAAGKTGLDHPNNCIPIPKQGRS